MTAWLDLTGSYNIRCTRCPLAYGKIKTSRFFVQNGNFVSKFIMDAEEIILNFIVSGLDLNFMMHFFGRIEFVLSEIQMSCVIRMSSVIKF